jgi:hypothetical protein
LVEFPEFSGLRKRCRGAKYCWIVLDSSFLPWTPAANGNEAIAIHSAGKVTLKGLRRLLKMIKLDGRDIHHICI